MGGADTATRMIVACALFLVVGCGPAAGSSVPPTQLPAPSATATSLPPNIALLAATPAFATVTAAQSLAELHMQRLRTDLDRGDFIGVSRESQAISGYLQQMADVQATLDSVASLQATAVPGIETPPPLIAPEFVQESQALEALVQATIRAQRAGATATAAVEPSPLASPFSSTATAAPARRPTARPTTVPRASTTPPSPSALPTAPSATVAPSATAALLATIGLPVGIAPLPPAVGAGRTLVVHAASFAQVSCRLDAELADHTAVPVPSAEKQTDERGAVAWWWPVPEAAQSSVTLTVRCQKGAAVGQRTATVRVE